MLPRGRRHISIIIYGLGLLGVMATLFGLELYRII